MGMFSCESADAGGNPANRDGPVVPTAYHAQLGSFPVVGDEERAGLSWKSGKSVEEIGERYIRLRPFLESGTVYAIYSG